MSFYPGITEGTVRTDGVEVKYYDSGDKPGGGAPIVLLHGTGGSAENNFAALLPMLSFRHRVIALDFVDEIPEGNGPLALNHFVDQTSAVINKLSPGRPVTLVGYSLGAVVAAVAAAEQPELVRNLVLVAGWMKTDAQQKLRNSVWQQLHDSESEALAEFMLLTAFSSRFVATRPPAELEKLIAGIKAGPNRARKMRLNRTVDISAKLSAVRARTLVIGCSDDQMAPIRHSHALFGAIDDSRFVEISSGHAVVHERPAELFTRIDNFVQGHASDDAGAVLAPVHA